MYCSIVTYKYYNAENPKVRAICDVSNWATQSPQFQIRMKVAIRVNLEVCLQVLQEALHL